MGAVVVGGLGEEGEVEEVRAVVEEEGELGAGVEGEGDGEEGGGEGRVVGQVGAGERGEQGGDGEGRRIGR